MHESMIGRTVSHYRLVEPLGSENLPASVYEAEEIDDGSRVALCFLPDGFSREERKRLMGIASAASRLADPHVEQLLEIGETESGVVFWCSDLKPGETLDRRIGRGPLDVEDALEIAAQTAEGLERVHDARILHGALRPDQLKILGQHQVEIHGFGLCALAGRGLSVRTGDLLTGLAYRPPELIRGGRLSRRTDVWSLGVVLYEMLAGERPFAGTTAGTLAEAILGQNPRPISDLAAVPPELDEVLSRALAKDAAQRHSRIGEFGEELRAITAQLRKLSGAERLKLKKKAGVRRSAASRNGGKSSTRRRSRKTAAKPRAKAKDPKAAPAKPSASKPAVVEPAVSKQDVARAQEEVAEIQGDQTPERSVGSDSVASDAVASGPVVASSDAVGSSAETSGTADPDVTAAVATSDRSAQEGPGTTSALPRWVLIGLWLVIGVAFLLWIAGGL